MHQILNTLYVMTQGAYLHLDHDTVKVEVKNSSPDLPEEKVEETKMQVPLHHLGGITCFGDVSLSSGLLARCAEDGRAVVLLDYSGRFKGRLEGPVSGNVLLRRAQHATLSDPALPVSWFTREGGNSPVFAIPERTGEGQQEGTMQLTEEKRGRSAFSHGDEDPEDDPCRDDHDEDKGQ